MSLHLLYSCDIVTLTGPITMIYIEEISHKVELDSEWRQLANKLGISKARLQSIVGKQTMYSYNQQQSSIVQGILIEWLKKCSAKTDKVYKEIIYL